MSDYVEVIDNNNDNLSETNTGKFTGKVFGYMGIGLAITAIVSLILTFVFTRIFPIVGSDDLVNEEYFIVYVAIFAVSFIALLITSIVIRVSSLFRGNKNVVAPFIVYAVLMGVMMAALTLVVPGYIMSITLAITMVTFLAMFLIGYFAKSNLSTLAIVASGLAIGAFLIVMMNLLIFWFFPVYATLSTWLASGIIFIAMMLFTIVDIRKVKEIAASGMGNNNIALYCAFTLYVDFIYMFIRILRIVIILFGKSKR